MYRIYKQVGLSTSNLAGWLFSIWLILLWITLGKQWHLFISRVLTIMVIIIRRHRHRKARRWNRGWDIWLRLRRPQGLSFIRVLGAGLWHADTACRVNCKKACRLTITGPTLCWDIAVRKNYPKARGELLSTIISKW